MHLESLRRQLYRTIYELPGAPKYALGVQQPIRIIMKGWKVSLEGVIDNEGDKNIANIQASGAPGVSPSRTPASREQLVATLGRAH
jgi:hyperosmotically inducible periplasmic protein